MGLLHGPGVLLMAEPPPGLDPEIRIALWEEITRLNSQDKLTIVLTTHYLEEADKLADEIVVLDHGKVAARGTPAELKARIGGERIVITFAQRAELQRAHAVLDAFFDAPPTEDEPGPEGASAHRLIAKVRLGTRLVELVRALDAAGIDATDLQRREVTLDDVFLTITTRASATAEAA